MPEPFPGSTPRRMRVAALPFELKGDMAYFAAPQNTRMEEAELQPLALAIGPFESEDSIALTA